MQHLLTTLEAALPQLEAHAQPTWDGLVEPLGRLRDGGQVGWGIVGRRMGVQNSDALRQAHQTVQPEVVQCSKRLAQSRAIYDGLQTLRDSAAWKTLDSAQQ